MRRYDDDDNTRENGCRRTASCNRASMNDIIFNQTKCIHIFSKGANIGFKKKKKLLTPSGFLLINIL